MDDVLQKISEQVEKNEQEDDNGDEVIEMTSITAIAKDGEQAAKKQEPEFEDFDNLAKSEILSDMPNSSSLFKAIINKPIEGDSEEDKQDDAQIAKVLDNQENYFVPKTALRMPEEEPELFPSHNPAPIKSKQTEEVEELIVTDNEPKRRSFIEIMTGRSIAKRNQQKQGVRVQEPVAPSFAEEQDDKVNLEIPSFLRRR